MTTRAIGIGLAAVAALAAGAARAEEKEKEPSAVVELGGAGEWNLQNGVSAFGPTAAIEFTPIKNWLEIEVGTSTMFRGGDKEWGADLLFKKPFELSDKVEFMLGAGPEWSYTTGGDGAKISGEVSAEFMVWPAGDHRLGWFVEQSYHYSFSAGHEQSLGVAAGLLIPIP